ncbi:agmatinase [Curvivirga aplysinae]|uniref:agmatinase n=1 Tax=Curvivirga aplysinae TaxID=2529852 RepID=UPI0012BBB643|nr:agmatinase [Curvivirga aplysinae]MTI09415.1 agmatinase [Curvivirga aplysinae]
MGEGKVPNFKPISGSDLPRFAGIPTFMRLPHVEPQSELAKSHVDVGIIGIPWDGGTTNRAGARHGPRQMRDMSTLMRNVHHVSGIQPFELIKCADMGDSPVNPIQIEDTLDRVETFVRSLVEDGIAPVTAGGDHLVSLPIMRAIKDKLCGGKPMGMVHFDAHTDTWDRYFGGSMYTHGTPFRRAIEEGLLDPKRTVQIGIRGSLYTPEDKDWGLEQGIRVIEIEEYFDLGVEGVIKEARRVIGDDPTYVSFDVDCLDPVYAPGTGTPEIGGMTTHEAQQIVRGLRGADIISADVVEVSPPFDQSGATALVGVTIMWEILCLLAENMQKKGLVK